MIGNDCDWCHRPRQGLIPHIRDGALLCDDCWAGDWTYVGTCTCNAPLCGPGSGHESYCGWEQMA